MLDGIHILNNTMVTEIPDWAITILLVGILLLIAGFIIVDKTTKKSFEIIGVLAACIGAFCFIAICIIQPEVETGRYQYEVIVNETVSFNDLCEKYEVVERRGEIWVLEDKEK